MLEGRKYSWSVDIYIYIIVWAASMSKERRAGTAKVLLEPFGTSSALLYIQRYSLGVVAFFFLIA